MDPDPATTLLGPGLRLENVVDEIITNNYNTPNNYKFTIININIIK